MITLSCEQVCRGISHYLDDDLIPHIVRRPGLGQSSPRLFLTRYAPPSARPGPHPRLHVLLQELTPFPFLLRLAARTFRRLEGGRAVLEELFLPAVEHRRLQAQFFTQIGNRDLVSAGTLGFLVSLSSRDFSAGEYCLHVAEV